MLQQKFDVCKTLKPALRVETFQNATRSRGCTVGRRAARCSRHLINRQINHRCARLSLFFRNLGLDPQSLYSRKYASQHVGPTVLTTKTRCVLYITVEVVLRKPVLSLEAVYSIVTAESPRESATVPYLKSMRGVISLEDNVN